MKKVNNAIMLTIFSTALITAVILVLYLMLAAELDAGFFRPAHILLLAVSALLAYVASSVIIDRILNPLRLMISKVNEIGNMDFSKPLPADSENDELREYAAAFNNMSQKLSGYIERQKRFISDASHELVTPVTIINGHADLLLRRGMDDSSMLENGLSVIKKEALRMNEIIDSLLLLAKSDSGKQSYSFEQINISELIEESVAEALIIAPEFKFETDLESGVIARCDALGIRRVMRIILSNAVKYSFDAAGAADTAGTADVKIIQIKCGESHGLVNISVKDNGIGIAPEHLPRIFDRFYRVDDSRSKKTGSSGLGLAIAKEIINAHGGDIRVRSEIDKGTEFSVVLSPPSLR